MFALAKGGDCHLSGGRRCACQREGVNSLFSYELVPKANEADGAFGALGASGASVDAIDVKLNSWVGCEIGCCIQLDGAGRFFPGVVGVAADHFDAGLREINSIVTEIFYGAKTAGMSRIHLLPGLSGGIQRGAMAFSSGGVPLSARQMRMAAEVGCPKEIYGDHRRPLVRSKKRTQQVLVTAFPVHGAEAIAFLRAGQAGGWCGDGDEIGKLELPAAETQKLIFVLPKKATRSGYGWLVQRLIGKD